ncbi:MarR family winged helix-turn-helix transcriptional regulator [Salidesulfovibrio onnuriiensis]|uniref:MarR family winged helix-turn-helix transcriptional regulator n=1 Tax=Salidesulfovibrio onnuriiensis TaxID=2583823 RepID=UPI0011C809B0|nr:MarR family winged helix-turn-helix transcriptional regulator [Salidesulfovibrio onnuriiensis]
MKLQGAETMGRFIAMLHRMANLYLGQELSHMNIGSGQYIYLAELFTRNGQSQDELTRKIYVDKANTARALKRLEDTGYVRRAMDENDKRVKRAYLNAPALKIEDEFWAILTKWSDVLTQGIPQARQRQLMEDLKTMMGNAAKHLESKT